MNNESSLNPFYAARFDNWYSCNLKKLTPAENVKVLLFAFDGLQKCTLDTLSSVTVSAVFNRIFCSAVLEFPALSNAELKTDSFLSTIDLSLVTDESAPDLVRALRFLIVKFITIIERLTAGVLTEDLFEELSNSKTLYLEASLKNIRGQND